MYYCPPRLAVSLILADGTQICLHPINCVCPTFTPPSSYFDQAPLSQRLAAGMQGFKPRRKIKGPAPHSFHLVIYILKVHLMLLIFFFFFFLSHLDISICQPRHLSSSEKRKRVWVIRNRSLLSSHPVFSFLSLQSAAELGSAARR